jgi:hypothetical protein
MWYVQRLDCGNAGIDMEYPCVAEGVTWTCWDGGTLPSHRDALTDVSENDNLSDNRFQYAPAKRQMPTRVQA